MNRLYPILVLALGVGCFINCQRHVDPPDRGSGDAIEDVDPGQVDLTRKPLERIPVGTVIGSGAPAGWTHLVLIAVPTLTPADAQTAPRLASYYAQLFKFTVLARVEPDDAPGARFHLACVARGFATNIAGQERIVSGSDTLGADVGLFGRRILDENEKILDHDVRQVVRTRSMLIFDAKSVMLVGGNHVTRIMRHALLTDPARGGLETLVWLLTDDYEAAEPTLQLLPHAMREERLLSVQRDKFTLGMPSRDAFALRRIPQGAAIAYTPELRLAATTRVFVEAQVPRIEQVLRAAVARGRAEGTP
jgi:hypothetical protein